MTTQHVIVDGADFVLRQLSVRARNRGESALQVRFVELANQAAAKKSDHAELGRRAYSLIFGAPFPTTVIRTREMTDDEHGSRLADHNAAVWQELRRVAAGGAT